MQFVVVRWYAVLGADQCWVVLWISIEDYGRITSHAQSTAATHLIFAVNSDVVHLIVICWALLLQSLGAEQIVHTRLPTEIFVHACVEVKPISIRLCAFTPATKHRWLPRRSPV